MVFFFLLTEAKLSLVQINKTLHLPTINSARPVVGRTSPICPYFGIASFLFACLFISICKYMYI